MVASFDWHELLVFLIFLIVLSAFFSGSETGMMSLNRYRLRHLVSKGNKKAKRISRLLSRPDRLLGVILIGNTFGNVLASSVATYITLKVFPQVSLFLVSIILTIALLIFAETAPKTMAALYPERYAFKVSGILSFLLKLLYPLVWAVNVLANSFLRLFGVVVAKQTTEALSADELRTIVLEAEGKISSNYQQMLLRILELEQVTVADVMVPRNEIYGIDMESDWPTILYQVADCSHAHVPLYHGDIDNVVGIVNLRKVLVAIQHDSLTNREALLALSVKTYFIPEAAGLNQQLLHFQDKQCSFGLVVDEYGDIQGLVTLQDILEEIVGEFAYNIGEIELPIHQQKDGSVLVDGRMNLRELNRQLDWDFPVDGPKTLSGLIIEYLEMIPKKGMGARVAGYPIEVETMKRNMIRTVRVWPELFQLVEAIEDDDD